jgi:methyl-accepting chemotaxis protein
MVEFLMAQLDMTELISGVKEKIEKRSKLKLNDLSAIDDYLIKKKKLKTARDKIEYLNSMDPSSFDEELQRLGVTTMHDVNAVTDAFQMMPDVGSSFAAALKESGALERITVSLPKAAEGLKLSSVLPGIPAEQFRALGEQLQKMQPPILDLNLISQSFVNLPSPVLANELNQQMQAVLGPASQLVKELSTIASPMSEIAKQISAATSPMSEIAKQISAATSPMSEIAKQINTVNDSFAQIQRQLAPLPSTVLALKRLYGSKHSRIFHRSFCPYVRRIDRANLVYFDSAEEASEAGYSPCRFCQPL